MARLWSDDASEQDRADCARWRAASRSRTGRQTLLAFEDKLAGVQPQAGGHALRRAVSGTGRRRAMRLLGLGALLAGSGYALRGTDAWRGATADCGTGKSALTLPDGTRLTLSTGTAIDLRFDANARLVLLLAGEIRSPPRPIPPQRRDRSGCAAGTAPCRRWARASRSGKTTRMRAWRCSRARLKSARRRARRRHPPGCGPGLAFSRYRADPPTPVSEDAASWSRGVLVADAWRLDDFWPSWAATGPACCAATRRGPARERRVSAARHRPGAAQPNAACR